MLSILIADDEEGIRNLLELWLRDAGHFALAVRDGMDATKLVREQRFDLLITDVIMPGADGFEVMTQFKRFQPFGRILAISGGGKFMDAKECLRVARGLGVNGAIMKPFNMRQLLASVQEIFHHEQEALS